MMDREKLRESVVAEVGIADLDRVVQCHRAAFPKALSTALGHKVSKRTLEWYLADKKRFLIWIEIDNKCAGYAGGMISDGEQVHGSASGMIQFAFKDVVLALLFRPWLWFHPELMMRYPLIFKNIYYRLVGYRVPVKKRYNQAIEPQVGLVVIGVHPDFQGSGLGSKLLKAFEEKSVSMGYSHMRLSVLSGNTQAIKSYQRNGWHIYMEENGSLKMEKTV